MGGVSLSSLYPIGSVYITVESTDVCPLELLGIGKWEKVQVNRVLQSSSSSNKAGTLLAAGLPNVTGQIGKANSLIAGSGFFKGAFYGITNQAYNTQWGTVAEGNWRIVGFDASRESSIYGKSTTVQPPALVVDVWKRVA